MKGLIKMEIVYNSLIERGEFSLSDTISEELTQKFKILKAFLHLAMN